MHKKILNTIVAVASLSALACPLLSVGAAGTDIFHDDFEGSTDDWQGRGSASVMTSGRTAFAGSEALLVQDRASAWNGASKSLDSSIFVGGSSYSFSINVIYFDGDETDTFYLKLQYTDSTGTTIYASVAEVQAVKGEWSLLENVSYQIPDDAENMHLYVETAETVNNFYIDEFICTSEESLVLDKGDVNGDDVIDVYDMVFARKGLVEGFENKKSVKAADVNSDGKFNIADAVLIQEFILGRINEFPVPDNKWDLYEETASAEMQKFYSDSILHMGNTSRLAEKISSAESGESVKVAYLGGSITEGKKYTDPFSSYFRSTFGSNASFINAGMSGTSSVVGLMRSQRDILDAAPDIIFLEFSVNDHPEEIYKKSYESLVKKCLSQENEPAVIIIINRAKSGYSMKEQMAAIGRNYDVPVISMDDALTNAFNSGLLSSGDYFSDEYHPHDNGGKLISDCLGYYFRQALKTENRSEKYVIPETTVYGSEYQTGTIVPVSELGGFNPGSFAADNSNTRFGYGYTFRKNNGNTPMTFTAQGKGIFIVFKSNQNSSLGNIVVTVNGKENVINGNRNYAWGGADADIAYIQDTSGELDVSVAMENANSDFTIWGIGVVE